LFSWDSDALRIPATAHAPTLWAMFGQIRPMNYRLRIIIVLSLISILTLGFQKKYKYDFTLMLASCFDSDTVDIKINGQDIINNAVATSDFSTGLTKVFLYQAEEGLFTFWETNNKKKFNRLDFKREITIDILVNGVKTTKTIDLKKGKIIMVDKCFVKADNGQTSKQLTFRQFKKQVTLE
jgi:hypothetical protein